MLAATNPAAPHATARQFIDRGFDALTIEGVAAEAKVGKQTIYRWWPSRTALVAECLAEGLLMPSWSVPPDSGDVRADLREWLSSRTAKFWLPERWTFIDEVPKTSVGKFDKKVLRAAHASGDLQVQRSRD